MVFVAIILDEKKKIIFFMKTYSCLLSLRLSSSLVCCECSNRTNSTREYYIFSYIKTMGVYKLQEKQITIVERKYKNTELRDNDLEFSFI